jgi:hypothetical protein
LGGETQMMDRTYVISDQVLAQFVEYNKSSIEDIIINKFHQMDVIDCHYNQIYFTFNKDCFFIYKVDHNSLVSDLFCRNYDQLITEEFLNQFSFIRNSLPPRLKRWASAENQLLLKNEIIEALTYNKMVISYDSDCRVIFEWKVYGLKFELSEDFSFSNIL